MSSTTLLIVLIFGAVVARQSWHVVRWIGAYDTRRELDDLQELVGAWQAANHDEVRTMDERVAFAHAGMAAAEQSARVTAHHLTWIEDALPRLRGRLQGG